jgi:hypothetical protein
MENRHRRSRQRQDDDGRRRLPVAASGIGGGAVGIRSSRESTREGLRDGYVQTTEGVVEGQGRRRATEQKELEVPNRL